MTIEEERNSKALDRKRHAQRIINAYHTVFAGPDGEVVLNDLTAAFGVNLPAFLSTTTRPGESITYDPIYAAIRDGQRSILLHIQAKLDAIMTGDANLTEGDKVLTGLSQ